MDNTFAKLAKGWLKRLRPAEARAAIREMLPAVFPNPQDVDIDVLIEQVKAWQPPPPPKPYKPPAAPQIVQLPRKRGRQPGTKMKTIEADVEIVTKSEKTEPMTELRGRPNKKAAALVKSLIGAARIMQRSRNHGRRPGRKHLRGRPRRGRRGPSGEGP